MGHIITIVKNDADSKTYIAVENNHLHMYVEGEEMPRMVMIEVKDSRTAKEYLKKEPNSRFLEL